MNELPLDTKVHTSASSRPIDPPVVMDRPARRPAMPKPADPVDSAAAAAAAETVPKSTSSSKSEPSSSSPNPIPRLARADAVASRSASPPRGASSAPIPSARSRSPNKLEDKSLARAPGDRLLCRRPSPASAACNAAFPSGSAAASRVPPLRARWRFGKRSAVDQRTRTTTTTSTRPSRTRAWANAGGWTPSERPRRRVRREGKGPSRVSAC